MTQRNRRRQRRRGGIGGKLLIVGGGVFAVVAIAVIAVTSWVLDVAADAPSLATCKPIDRGGNSVLYAADGSKLGRDRLRRSPHAGLDRAHPQERAAGDGGDRGPALLRARRRRPRGHPPRRGQGPRSRQGGRGRLDDHPAAGPQPLHRQPAAEPRTQDRRGEAGDGVREAALAPADPRLLPQHRLLRDDRGRHRGRRPGGLADLLRPAGLEADPAAGGAAGRDCRRRPPNTTRSSTRGRRWPAATRCCGRWTSSATSPPTAPRRRQPPGSDCTSPTPTSTTASPTSSTTSRTS